MAKESYWPTCGLSGIHLPAGLCQLLSQLHVLLSLTACDCTHVTAQCQHGGHEAHQVVHLVLDSLPTVQVQQLLMYQSGWNADGRREKASGIT